MMALSIVLLAVANHLGAARHPGSERLGPASISPATAETFRAPFSLLPASPSQGDRRPPIYVPAGYAGGAFF
ncbi:hypothetical protein [Mesorhizobium erdmanii]|uniref:hypothetical protein n=1 Tax=Mesorhizobium erdmanii TaxID=1777866 RepID=UPI00041EC03B|nr:hypothetical protein [Mesorhizobium erdmanii]